jgi:Ni/Co efflux regulator RcnB
MKKTLITAVAVFALISPLASAQQPNMQQHQGQYQNQNQDQRGDQTNDRDHRNDNQHRDRRGHRQNWRDMRGDARWDESQHNGYYSGSRWHYGPPAQDARNVTYGYHRWSTGQRLGYYNTRYQEVDYRSHRLRAPRRGYHWVEDNDGNFLLAAIATGLIASVILSR